MIPRVLLPPPFPDLRNMLARQENITRNAYLATEIVLEATPFNHLSIWAYMAFALITIAVSTVLGYMTYTCCYSARRRYYGPDTRAARRSGAVRINSTRRDSGQWAKGGGSRFAEEKGKVTAGDGKRSNAKTKAGTGRPWVGKTILEMKKLGFKHHRKHSESEENIIQYRSSLSKSSLVKVPEHPFAVENQYLTLPPLAYTSERAPNCIPFHLPPPPSSPTPAYKEFLERQKQLYGSMQPFHSPVSPSPSLFPDGSPPNLSKASTLSARPHRPPKNQSRRKAATANERTEHSASIFDSNNIRFASPLNPFATPTTTFRWDDPKLSPVSGSVITNSPTLTVSDSNFSSQASLISAGKKSGNTFSPNRKAARLLSPQQANTESDGRGYGHGEKENLHPISHVQLAQSNDQQDNRF